MNAQTQPTAKSSAPVGVSLAVRVFLGFAALLAVFILLGLFAMWRLGGVAEGPSEVSQLYLPLYTDLNRAELARQSLKRDAGKVFETIDPAVRQFLAAYARDTVERAQTVSLPLADGQRLLRRVADRRAIIGSENSREVAALTRTFDDLVQLERDARRALVALMSDVEANAAATLDNSAPASPTAADEFTDRRVDLEAADLKFDRALLRAKNRVRQAVARALRRAEREADNLLLILATLTAIGIVLALAVWIATNRALRPLPVLISAARRIARGEYTTRVEPLAAGGADELAALAIELDKLAAAIQAREDALTGEREKVEAGAREMTRVNLALLSLKAYSENIVRSIRLGVVAADADLRVTSLNPAAERIWGPAAAVTGEPVTALYPGHPVLSSRPRLTAVMGGERVLTVENVTTGSADGERVLDVSVVPLRSREGMAEGVLLIADDVTEKTAMRRRLLQAERLATIGKLSAQVAHEVRNPLNALGLNVELLEEEVQKITKNNGDPAEAIAIVRSIAREIDRLATITEQYLAYARLPPPQLERESINPLLASLLSFLQAEFSAANVRIEQDFAADLPAIDCDPNQLRQAFMNMMRNALDSMRGGGGVLTVITRKSGNGVTIDIRDTGCGMPPEVAARAFDPFYSTKPDGTGLGLSLTQQIVRLHGGEIRCASREGAGTTFSIQLPAEGLTAAAAPALAPGE